MRYNEITTKVHLAMKHMDKPCLGEECDGDQVCKRHGRTVGVVMRAYQVKRRSLEGAKP